MEITGPIVRPPAHMDPRIRARRIAVQRGEGRRRLQRLVDAGLLVMVALGFLAALRSPLLDVDRVQVSGNAHTSADAVVAASGIGRGDQLIDLDLQAAGEAVAALPWVRTAELHRGIDGAIAVEITERTPVAVVGQGAGAVIVDAEGRALAPLADEPGAAASLAVIEAPGALEPGEFAGPEAADALAVAAKLGGVVDMGVRLSIEDGRLTGLVDPGIQVVFGDAGQLDAKVRSLRTVLDQVDLACAAMIDLRSPGSPVLTREEGCS
jgi:cell division protein FtsQ